jgi:hypothetical protein
MSTINALTMTGVVLVIIAMDAAARKTVASSLMARCRAPAIARKAPGSGTRNTLDAG